MDERSTTQFDVIWVCAKEERTFSEQLEFLSRSIFYLVAKIPPTTFVITSLPSF